MACWVPEPITETGGKASANKIVPDQNAAVEGALWSETICLFFPTNYLLITM